MRSLSQHLAWRYLTRTAYHTNISLMTYIAFIGIAIGTFALALVSAIMSGFEYEVHKKLQGIHAPIRIQSYGQSLNAPAIKKVLKKEFPAITAIGSSSTGYAIVHAHDTDSAPDVVMLRGIEPEQEAAISGLDSKIITAQKDITQLLSSDKVLIGKTLADNLGVAINDTIQLAYTSEEQRSKKRLSLDTTHVKISGVFNTGIDEFDGNMIFCSLDTLHQLFPSSGIQTIRLKTNKNADNKILISHLKKRLGLPVYAWHDLYPALVSALKLEKYAMFLILALIVLVASMSIISLLFMRITQKRSDIAILRAMGMQHKTITRIFIMLGMSITTAGCIIGIACAAFASWILNNYPFITLPDSYYVSHLPAHFSIQLAGIVMLLVTVIGLLASWIPARKTKDINISQVLRFEG